MLNMMVDMELGFHTTRRHLVRRILARRLGSAGYREETVSALETLSLLIVAIGLTMGLATGAKPAEALARPPAGPGGVAGGEQR